jgi:hypothetical protein
LGNVAVVFTRWAVSRISGPGSEIDHLVNWGKQENGTNEEGVVIKQSIYSTLFQNWKSVDIDEEERSVGRYFSWLSSSTDVPEYKFTFKSSDGKVSTGCSFFEAHYNNRQQLWPRAYFSISNHGFLVNAPSVHSYFITTCSYSLGCCRRIRRRPVRNSKQRLKITRGDEEIAEKEKKLEQRTVNRIQLWD